MPGDRVFVKAPSKKRSSRSSRKPRSSRGGRRYGSAAARTLFKKGAVVLAHDAGAVRWNRPVEKPEGRGKVVQHFIDLAGRKTPPYLVQFDDGRKEWYGADEVEPAGRVIHTRA